MGSSLVQIVEGVLVKPRPARLRPGQMDALGRLGLLHVLAVAVAQPPALDALVGHQGLIACPAKSSQSAQPTSTSSAAARIR